MPDGIVIVGGGIAGQTLCETLRERDREVPITLVCGEEHYPYDRVHLSELLVSEDSLEERLQLRPGEWYEDNDVSVLLGRRVAAIDALGRSVSFEDGTDLPFDRLALATGSNALLPSIEGTDLPGVHVYRGPEDCDAIRKGAAQAKKAAVMGGGLLGLEAARGIQAQDCPVTVVHIKERLMDRQLDSECAAMLLPAMRELGMDVELERRTSSIHAGNGHVQGLRFADGDEIAADLVVISVGIRPETMLAERAGIDCNRGVLVDDRMHTSEDGIVALGECSEHRGKVYGIVAPIYEQARVAADTLLEVEEPSEYHGSLPWARLKVAEIDLVSIGDVDAEHAAVTSHLGERFYRKLTARGGRAAGAILMGDTRGTEALLESIRSGQEVDDPLAQLAEASHAGPEDLPDQAQVCDCNGVCKGEIVRAVVDEGLSSTSEVMTLTRAGTACGSCKPLVTELVSLAGGGTEGPSYLCACRKQTREWVVETVSREGYKAVSEVSEACGTGRECGLCKPALAYLVQEVSDNQHREEHHARHINERVHANIQNDGTFSVVPRMHGGVTTPDQLRRIADAAERYDARLVKVTGGQRIDLLGIKKQDLPHVWRDIGMPSGHAYGRGIRQVKTCVGTDFCRFGIGDSTALGVELERMWEGLYTPGKVKSGVSGCPRNCAEATVKDIGLVAIEGGWQVVVGGAAGANVRKADTLVTVDTAEEAKRVATAFLQFYREGASFKERTYQFVPRLGLDVVREAVLDEESQERLLERFRIARAAVNARDPWLERDDPNHHLQFEDLPGKMLSNGSNGGGSNGGGSFSSDAEEADDDAALVGPPPEGAR
ncbi:MAG: nitrite reductase large subunit NirB [Thermoleophilaceae bacterium]